MTSFDAAEERVGDLEDRLDSAIAVLSVRLPAYAWLNAEYYRTEDEANPGDPPRGEEEIRAKAALEAAHDLKQLLQGPPLSQSKLDAVEKRVVEVEMDVSDLPDDKLEAPWN